MSKIISLSKEEGSDLKYYNKNLIKIISFFIKNDFMFILSFIITNWMVIFKVRIDINKNKYDIIHAHDINSFNGLFNICKRKKIKLLLQLHGFLNSGNLALKKIHENSWAGKYLLKKEIKAFTRAEIIIANSTYYIDYLKQYTDINKIRLIYNFVDCNVFIKFDEEIRKSLKEQFNFNKNEFILMYAGRLAKSKGIKYILEAMKLIDNIPVKLIIAGDGPERDNYTYYVNNNNLSEKIIFKGDLNKNDLINLYNITNCFIMTPVSDEGPIEGTSLAILEAMSCGLPVITTPIGGINNIFEKISESLVLEEKNSSAISAAIIRLYKDRELAEALSKKSYELVRNDFSVEAGINKLCKVYEEILG